MLVYRANGKALTTALTLPATLTVKSLSAPARCRLLPGYDREANLRYTCELNGLSPVSGKTYYVRTERVD